MRESVGPGRRGRRERPHNMIIGMEANSRDQGVEHAPGIGRLLFFVP
jgi:hypothetical protein